MKLVLLVGIIFYTAEARVHTQLEDETVREFVDEYKFQDPHHTATSLRLTILSSVQIPDSHAANVLSATMLYNLVYV